MKQVAREKARGEILTELLQRIQHRVGFVDDPEGAVKATGGQLTAESGQRVYCAHWGEFYDPE
ncbi:hypothetical protein FOA52_007467 [Chlamydomonas sp. UWO 241]|nr:hypothetical protein FOA52_007467 [Chlamydomonas sp. UWO 241]